MFDLLYSKRVYIHLFIKLLAITNEAERKYRQKIKIQFEKYFNNVFIFHRGKLFVNSSRKLQNQYILKLLINQLCDYILEKFKIKRFMT